MASRFLTAPVRAVLAGILLGAGICAAALPASAEPGSGKETAARVIHHALSTKRPRTRYRVGADAKITWALSRMLPDRTVDALLGRSGMSVVYRAEDRRLRRNVALKLLAPELAEDERFRERFLRESELAASLDHPHIVPIYDAGEVEGQLYIAMRYVPGGDLRGLLRREGHLAPARAMMLLAQVADAAAHLLPRLKR